MMFKVRKVPDKVFPKDVQHILSYSNRQAVREILKREPTTNELVDYFLEKQRKEKEQVYDGLPIH